MKILKEWCPYCTKDQIWNVDGLLEGHRRKQECGNCKALVTVFNDEGYCYTVEDTCQTCVTLLSDRGCINPQCVDKVL